MCEMQYFLQYVLGIKSKPNQRTEKGSIVHKALELLAHKKVCEQEGKTGFYEEDESPCQAQTGKRIMDAGNANT